MIYHATAQGPMPRGLRPFPPTLDRFARAWRNGADPAGRLLFLRLHQHGRAGQTTAGDQDVQDTPPCTCSYAAINARMNADWRPTPSQRRKLVVRAEV